MIRKFAVITSVGRFKTFKAGSDLPVLGSCGVFFGSNGHGKSTITTILRSLACCETDGADYLKGKRTFGSDKPTNVVIEWDGSDRSVFQGDRWTKPLPAGKRIHIFDSEYIKDNLFTESVTIDHRRAICGIVLGPEGQALANRLNRALEEQKAHTKTMKSLKADLEERQSRVGSKHKYLDIPNKCSLADVSAKLEQLEKEIANKKAEEEIRRRRKVPLIPFGKLPVEDWKHQSQVSISSAHQSAQDTVRSHIAQHFDHPATGQRFIYQGLAVAKDSCPFCGQDLEPAEALMAAYRHAFDQSYAKAKEDLERLLSSVQSWNPIAYTSELAQAHAAACQAAEEWKRVFNTDLGISALPDSWKEAREELERLHRELTIQLSAKRDAVDQPVDQALFTSTLRILENVYGWTEEANRQIEAFNSGIDEFLRSLGETTLSALQERQVTAKAYEQRFSANEIKWCEKYESEVLLEKELSEEVDAADKALRDYSGATFEKYQRSINATLMSLGCTFSLKELKPAELKGSIKSIPASLVLEIDKHEVSAEVQDRKKANFRNTLSEGDKNCLALAFFLAGLDQESDLSNDVVVFDDPVTSLDSDRRIMLLTEIERRAKKAGQCFIFTHNSDFLKVLATCEYFSCDNGACYVHVFAHGSHGSTIKPLSLDEYLRDEHSRRVERLVVWDQSGVFPSSSEVFKDVRRSLEYIIDVKWGHRLGNATNLGQQHRALTSQGLLTANLLEELDSIHTATSSQLHDNQKYHMLRDASHGEVCNILKRGLCLMESV